MAEIGDILQITATLTQGAGITYQNVYHVTLQSGPLANEDVLDDVGEYLEAIYTELDGYFANTLVYDTYTVRNLTTATDYGTRSWPSLVNGGGGAVARLPEQVAALVNARTFTAGRQGRKFFPPLAELAWNGTTWVVGAVTAMGLAGAAAYSTFVSSTSHTYQPGIRDTVTGLMRLVREVVVPAYAAIQRRRRTGLGI